MSGFERPLVGLAVLPWALFLLWLGWAQVTSLAAARRAVAPRFLSRVTRYSLASLVLHLVGVFGLGLGLLVLTAEPVARQRPDLGAGSGRALLLIDASASMYATDVEPFAAPGSGAGEEDVSRFEIARAVALELLTALDDMRFAIVTFSGTPTLHLPMTADRELARQSLETLEAHTYYQNTGSSLARALEAVFGFTGESAADLQVVLLGDGELPFTESFAEPLAGLVELGVPVHAVAIGSLEGQRRVIYDFRDVFAGKQDRRVLRRYETRREDRHYRELAAATGGRFLLAEPESVRALAEGMRTRAAAVERLVEKDSRDWSGWLALGLLAGCVGHLLFLTPARPPAPGGFELDRLGPARSRPGAAKRAAVGLLALALALWGCADSVARRAHRANERGLALDELGRFEAARGQFELSASFGFQPEIPIHNLARSLARRERFTEAHRLFQRALELEPDLVDAAFNDGVTLYEWGRAERDSRNCQLERTLELWRGARRRFDSIAGGVVERDEPAKRAGRNLERLAAEIAEVERLIAEPPEHCGASGGGADGGGEGEEESGSAGAGAAQDPGAGGSGRGSPPPATPEPPAASGPLTAEERQRIASELERIARQGAAEGKYYRRTRPEQFSRESWSQPEAVLWW